MVESHELWTVKLWASQIWTFINSFVIVLVFTELFFKMQFVKNVLVYVFGAFTFSFCYCFYEGFIHKIILVRRVLPFICISCPLKVFKFDTGIPRDSCAVLLLKTLTFLCLIYWTPKVLLNLVAPMDSAVSSLDLEQVNVFLNFHISFC